MNYHISPPSFEEAEWLGYEEAEWLGYEADVECYPDFVFDRDTGTCIGNHVQLYIDISCTELEAETDGIFQNYGQYY